MVDVGCPRCRGVVALHEGRPFVTASGGVELWHRGCWDRRGTPLAVMPQPIAIMAPRPHRRALGAIAVVALAGAGFAHGNQIDVGASTSSLANIELGSGEALEVHGAIASNEIAPPRPTGTETSLEQWYPLPEDNDVRLDVTFTSLGGWIHPVTDRAELMPERASRHFGSGRHGVDRAECGHGHCGVDLDGPVGRP